MRTPVKPLLCLSLVSLALAPCLVQAQIYLCKDASGRTLTSDRALPECVGAVREMGRSGQIVRIIAPPLTAQQRQQKQVEEQQSKAAEAAAIEKKRQDRSLMARYGSESEIEAARKRALEPSHEHIKRETQTLAAAEKQLIGAKTEIETYKVRKAAAPVILRHKAEETQLAIQDGKKVIQEREAEAAKINLNFDETLKRYRELSSALAAK